MKSRASVCLRAATLALSLMIPCLAVGDSMRCGKWVLNEATSPAELLQKCGEPLEKAVTQEDVLGKNANGHPVKLGVQVTERWLYKRSAGSLPMLVTIVDGKIESIERTE